jgi:hypothetical protein
VLLKGYKQAKKAQLMHDASNEEPEELEDQMEYNGGVFDANKNKDSLSVGRKGKKAGDICG